MNLKPITPQGKKYFRRMVYRHLYLPGRITTQRALELFRLIRNAETWNELHPIQDLHFKADEGFVYKAIQE